MEKQTDLDAIFREMPAAGYSDRPVARSTIEEILDVARRAPSGVNTQPWNVFVLQGQARAALLQAAAGVSPAGVGDAASQLDAARYFRFFDAPVGLMFTISRNLALGSELDYGMFLQSVTLAARARGLHTCVQTGWSALADQVLPLLGAAEDMRLLTGMALGYPDASQPPVQAPVSRRLAGTFTTWHV